MVREPRDEAALSTARPETGDVKISAVDLSLCRLVVRLLA
jgi:hypothetical protein